MTIDDSFKKPGSVPFKWEIRPGVPKLQNPKPLDPDHRHTKFGSEKQHQIQRKQKKQSPQFPETPKKLKPPPAGLCYQPPLEPRIRTRSSRSMSPGLGLPGPDVVPSGGYFPGKLKTNVKKIGYPKSEPEPEPDPAYYSNLEVSSGRSVSSSRSSVSPMPSSLVVTPTRW